MVTRCNGVYGYRRCERQATVTVRRGNAKFKRALCDNCYKAIRKYAKEKLFVRRLEAAQ